MGELNKPEFYLEVGVKRPQSKNCEIKVESGVYYLLVSEPPVAATCKALAGH